MSTKRVPEVALKDHPVGHLNQRSALRRLLNQGVLPATILLAGPAGIGKSLVTRELARTIFCLRRAEQSPGDGGDDFYGGCGECRQCRLFESGNLPDFHTVDCLDRETWSVARVRELLYSLALSAFSAAGRVVIFDQAEHLSLPAANALLKVLEEPRQRTHFILISSNAARVPATLRSRCQSWFFDRLPDPELRKVLAREYATPPRDADGHEIALPELTLLADGSPGALHELINEYGAWRDLRERLDLIADGSTAEAVTLAQELAKDKDRLRAMLRLLGMVCRTRMRATRDREEAARWALGVTNCLSAERLILERNLNALTMLTALLLELTPGGALPFTTFTNGATLLDRLVV